METVWAIVIAAGVCVAVYGSLTYSSRTYEIRGTIKAVNWMPDTERTEVSPTINSDGQVGTMIITTGHPEKFMVLITRQDGGTEEIDDRDLYLTSQAGDKITLTIGLARSRA